MKTECRQNASRYEHQLPQHNATLITPPTHVTAMTERMQTRTCDPSGASLPCEGARVTSAGCFCSSHNGFIHRQFDMKLFDFMSHMDKVLTQQDETLNPQWLNNSQGRQKMPHSEKVD